MRKSNGVSFHSIGKVSEEYASSDSFGEEDDLIYSDDSDNQQIFQSQELIVDLFPSIEIHNINLNPAESTETEYKLNDNEYNLDAFATVDRFEPELHIEQISLVVSQYIHIEQFPPQINDKTPIIMGWTNVRNTYSSDYQTILQNYIKLSFNNIRSRIKQTFLLSPNIERLSNLEKTRNEQTCNRILFHYNGYGYPQITAHNIWCSEKRTRDFTEYPLQVLFRKLQPPLAFIFDCDNAGVVIDTFKKVADEDSIDNTFGIDWHDWFCFCATSKGQSISSEPILPKDLFTNFLLNPLRATVMVSVLWKYRNLFLIDDFPVQMPFSNLWDEQCEDSKQLKDVMIAIIDAIACDGIPSDLYTKLFRTDHTTATLFRNYLLAQHYIDCAKATTTCYPELPNLANHPLWQQFTFILDTCLVHGDRPVREIIDDFYNRLVNTLKVYLDNGFDHMIKPYHLVLLYQMIIRNENDSRPIELLAKYAALKLDSHESLVTASFFPVLIVRLEKADEHSPVFHTLCFLILSLLYYNPKFETSIRHEDYISKLTRIMFDQTIPQETRTIVTAIVAFLVTTYERFLKTCNEYEFLEKIGNELKTSTAEQSFWLLMLIKRTFGLYSPSPQSFINSGLHLQVAAFTNHSDSSLRNAALSVLSSFMQPFESSVNGQLLFLGLHMIADSALYSRFHLLQMVKKYLLGFTNLPHDDLSQPALLHETFTDILDIFYNQTDFIETRDISQLFNKIDQIVRQKDFLTFSYSCCKEIVLMYFNDPHPSVSGLASLIISYLEKRLTADDDMDYLISEPPMDLSCPPEPISYCDDVENELMQLGMKQNEALFFTSLRNLLQKKQWSTDPATMISSSQSQNIIFIRRLSHGSVGFKFSQISSFKTFGGDDEEKAVCAAFSLNATGVMIGTTKHIIYTDEARHHSKYSLPYSASNIVVVDFNNDLHCIVSTVDGCVYVWQVERKSPTYAFRAIPCQTTCPLLLCVSPGNEYIYTYSDNDRLCCWDIKEERLNFERSIGANAQPTCLLQSTSEQDLFIAGFSNGVLREISTKEKGRECIPKDLQLLCAKDPIIGISSTCYDGSTIYFALTENGYFFTWDVLEHCKPIPIKKQKYRSFAVHQTWPIIIFAPENDVPFATTPDGNLLGVFQNCSPSSICIVHKTEPNFGFVSSKGDVTVFRMVQTK